MDLRSGRFVVLGLSVVAVVSACASARPERPDNASFSEVAGDGKHCDRSDQDSSAVPHLPLYRACAVQVRARLMAGGPRPNFDPPANGQKCYTAMVEFAVDTNGMVEQQTARVVRTNDPTFAQAALGSLFGRRFSPARIDGVAVRQLTTTTMGMSITRVTVPAGSGPPQSVPRHPLC